MAEDHYLALIDTLPSPLDMRYLINGYPCIILEGEVTVDESGMTQGALRDTEGYIDLNNPSTSNPTSISLGESSWNIQYWAPERGKNIAKICSSGGNIHCQALNPSAFDQDPYDASDLGLHLNTHDQICAFFAAQATRLAIQQGWHHIRMVEGHELMKFVVWAVAQLHDQIWTGEVLDYHVTEIEEERFIRVKEMFSAQFVWETGLKPTATKGSSSQTSAPSTEEAPSSPTENQNNDQNDSGEA